MASGWGKLEFTLFSLLASASLLAAYGVATFYSGVMYLAFTNLRPIFIINTFMAVLYEITECGGLIKLFEAVYIHRFE